MTRDHEQMELQATRIDGGVMGDVSCLHAVSSSRIATRGVSQTPLAFWMHHYASFTLLFCLPLPASHLHKCVVAVTVRQPLEKRSVPPTPAACRIKSRGRRQLVVHSPETPVNTVRVPARAVVVLRSAGNCTKATRGSRSQCHCRTI